MAKIGPVQALPPIWTSMTGAIQRKFDLEIIKDFLQQGFDVNQKMLDDHTPLMVAAWSGNLGAARLFIERGAAVNEKDDRGETALMMAVEHGHIALVQLLIEHGAALEKKSDTGGLTALMVAFLRENLDIAELLINSGANLNARNKSGENALWYAEMFCEPGVAQKMKEAFERRSPGGTSGTTQVANDAHAIAVERQRILNQKSQKSKVRVVSQALRSF